jgi:hypothetical protein
MAVSQGEMGVCLAWLVCFFVILRFAFSKCRESIGNSEDNWILGIHKSEPENDERKIKQPSFA